MGLKTARYAGIGWILFVLGGFVVIASSTYPMDIWDARRLARRCGAVRVFEVHDQTVANARYRFDHGIELARAHADTAAIQSGIGTARDDARAALGDGDPVAMAPRVGKAREVRGAVPVPVVITQNPRGMDGSGRVTTSSPCSPMTDRPESSNASTLAPRKRQLISPATTGTSGLPPTNAVQTSVPPLTEVSQTPGSCS